MFHFTKILQSISWSLPPPPLPWSPHHTAAMLSPGEEGWAALCQSKMNLWYSSISGTHSFGSENTNEGVNQELLLLEHHLPVHELHIGAQQENALTFLPAFRISGQEEVRVD